MIGRLALELGRIGETERLKSVARSGPVDDARAVTLVPIGNDPKPYAPAHATATPAINQGADIAISWVRRTRVGGALRAGSGEVNLAEDSEAYELDFVDPDGAVVRTVTSLTSPAYTYTVAMQVAGFPEGYPASAFAVYQISAQVGRGFAGRFDFADAPQLTTLGEGIAEGQAGSSTSNFPANTVMAQRYDGVSGQVLSASAYLGSSASGNMRIGLYADNAGEPGALIATTEEKAFTAASSGHWEEFAFTAPPTTVAGVKYWLACHTDVSVNSRGSDGSNQNDARRLIAQSYASGLCVRIWLPGAPRTIWPMHCTSCWSGIAGGFAATAATPTCAMYSRPSGRLTAMSPSTSTCCGPSAAHRYQLRLRVADRLRRCQDDHRAARAPALVAGLDECRSDGSALFLCRARLSCPGRAVKLRRQRWRSREEASCLRPDINPCCHLFVYERSIGGLRGVLAK